MNYEEEQRNELEALSEIYYNEIKVISDKTPVSFSINVRPQASSHEEFDAYDDNGIQNGSDEENSDDMSDDNLTAPQQDLSVELKFTLPPKYPEEKPSIEILESHCLEDQEIVELMDNLDRIAQESLGTVMIFMLVSDVVEWLVAKSEKEANELEQEREKKLKEIEAEETKRFEGTRVTEQTFLAWKAKFDAELLKEKLEQQKQQADQVGPKQRLTGRAMFETDKTLAESDLNFVEDLDQNQLEALLHNIDEFELDENDQDFEAELSGDEEDDFEDEEDESEEENVSDKQRLRNIT